MDQVKKHISENETPPTVLFLFFSPTISHHFSKQVIGVSITPLLGSFSMNPFFFLTLESLFKTK